MRIFCFFVIFISISSGLAVAQKLNPIEIDTLTVRKYDLGLKEPLFIVNDKKVSFAFIQNINPNDISHIDAMKPPMSLGKYGEDGKNGVISIVLRQKEEIKKD